MKASAQDAAELAAFIQELAAMGDATAERMLGRFRRWQRRLSRSPGRGRRPQVRYLSESHR